MKMIDTPQFPINLKNLSMHAFALSHSYYRKLLRHFHVSNPDLPLLSQTDFYTTMAMPAIIKSSPRMRISVIGSPINRMVTIGEQDMIISKSATDPRFTAAKYAQSPKNVAKTASKARNKNDFQEICCTCVMLPRRKSHPVTSVAVTQVRIARPVNGLVSRRPNFANIGATPQHNIAINANTKNNLFFLPSLCALCLNNRDKAYD